MEFKILLNRVLKELDRLGHEDLAKTVSRAENEKELISTLRNYITVFKSDAETSKFLDSLRDKKQVAQPAESLTERELNDIIFSGLDSYFKKKDSKLKIAKHYSSPDGDLCVHLVDKNGNESYYRILTIKT